jgi:choline dehydrogenase
LTAISDHLGGDPAWAPDAVYALLRRLETFDGVSPQPRGTAGPLDIKQAPSDPSADGLANDFVAALASVFGPNGSLPGFDVPTVADYNDPATPLSIFSQWQLTQQPGGARASASTALLPPSVRARPNLVVRTRSTAMRVLFDTEGGGAGAAGKPRARGVEYTQAGVGKVAAARREVVVAAGHRSSLLLEASGVGNPAIIGPLLAAVGRKVVVPLTGVGENLGNDGLVMVVLNATGAAGAVRVFFFFFASSCFFPQGRRKFFAVPRRRHTSHRHTTQHNNTTTQQHAPSPQSGGAFVPSNLYGGGAFLPWPNAASAPTAGGTSDRFTQLIGAPGIMDAEFGCPTFTVAPIVLNTTSRGSAHIQSADPLYEPLVEVSTFSSPADQANWLYALKDQVAPLVDAMAGSGYGLLSPTADVLAGADVDATLDWVFGSYVPSHHWFGTCAMGRDPAAGAVVDGAGRVHGARGLRVADASIYPFKLDGNTGMPAYVAGCVVARAILEGR